LKLIKLSANKDTFKTVNFKPRGITLIEGSKSKVGSGLRDKSFNGVGKSLIIFLVHFCLASKSHKELEAKLPFWEFTLEFEHKGERFKSTRNTSSQEIILLNDIKFSLEKFRTKFSESIFGIEKTIPYLTFRPLISRFIRPSRFSYNTYDGYVFKEDKNPHASIMNTGYLLGLDPVTINEKYQLYSKKKLINIKYTSAKNDPILRKFFGQESELKISIFDLKEQIASAEANLKKLKIAKDYHKIEEECTIINEKLTKLKNKKILYSLAIDRINDSLDLKTDNSSKKVVSIFKEAKFNFVDAVTKTLSDVEKFHKTLLKNRRIRLENERTSFDKKICNLETEIVSLQEAYDKLVGYLKLYGPLEQVVVLKDRVYQAKSELEKYEGYAALLKDYENAISDIESDLSKKDIETDKYLEIYQSILEKNNKTFRKFMKEFYPDNVSGLDISTNEGNNTIRYDLNVKVEHDDSDGVNEMKIFSFDFMLLIAKHHHGVNFIFHDSRLYNDVDPRQVKKLFLLAEEYSKDNDIQYIATLNENMIDNIKSECVEDEYERIFGENDSNIMLSLTDESPATKLLGINVDLKYDAHT